MSDRGGALQPYLMVIRKTLQAALCISHFDSMVVERHTKPEIEMQSSREVLMNPVIIRRSEHQSVLVETSVNSVRVSIQIKGLNDVEKLLSSHFLRFMTRRAESFEILRRKPATEGYHISFLITNVHLEQLVKDKLIEFIVEFVEKVDQEVNAMSIALNARARLCASTFMAAFE